MTQRIVLSFAYAAVIVIVWTLLGSERAVTAAIAGGIGYFSGWGRWPKSPEKTT